MRNFGFAEVTITRKTEQKHAFVWFFARLIVPLASPKLLTFGKTQINLVFRSLNRNFAGDFK